MGALTHWMPWANGYDREVGGDFLVRSQAEWDALTGESGTALASG
jgi:hypothetical protein